MTFSQIATINQPMRQGYLLASISSLSGWDTTNTLSVNLAESDGQLDGTTEASAQQGVTLALVDNELLAYETATLDAQYQYALSGLQRAMYGTAPAFHAINAPFSRLDAALVPYDLPANYIGKTLYFKFQSFNVFYSGLQSLADCAVYTFTPTGAGTGDPVLAQLESGLPTDLGPVTVAPAVNQDLGMLTSVVLSGADLGVA